MLEDWASFCKKEMGCFLAGDDETFDFSTSCIACTFWRNMARILTSAPGSTVSFKTFSAVLIATVEPNYTSVTGGKSAYTHMRDAINNGLVNTSTLDMSVRRIL